MQRNDAYTHENDNLIKIELYLTNATRVERLKKSLRDEAVEVHIQSYTL